MSKNKKVVKKDRKEDLQGRTKLLKIFMYIAIGIIVVGITLSILVAFHVF